MAQPAACDFETRSCCSREDTCAQPNLTNSLNCPFVMTCEDDKNDGASGFTCSNDDRNACRVTESVLYNCPSDKTAYPNCANCAQRGFLVSNFGRTQMCTGATINPRYSALCPFTVKTPFNARDEALGTGLTNSEALARCESFCETSKSRAVCIPSEDKPSDRQKFDPYAYACVFNNSKRDDTSGLPNATEVCASGGYSPNPGNNSSPPDKLPEENKKKDDKKKDDKNKDDEKKDDDKNDTKTPETQKERDSFCSSIESEDKCTKEGNRCKWTSSLFDLFRSHCASRSVHDEATTNEKSEVDSGGKCDNLKETECNISGCKWNSFGESCSPSWKVDLIVSAIVIVPFMLFIAILYAYVDQIGWASAIPGRGRTRTVLKGAVMA